MEDNYTEKTNTKNIGKTSIYINPESHKSKSSEKSNAENNTEKQTNDNTQLVDTDTDTDKDDTIKLSNDSVADSWEDL